MPSFSEQLRESWTVSLPKVFQSARRWTFFDYLESYSFKLLHSSSIPNWSRVLLLIVYLEQSVILPENFYKSLSIISSQVTALHIESFAIYSTVCFWSMKLMKDLRSEIHVTSTTAEESFCVCSRTTFAYRLH